MMSKTPFLVAVVGALLLGSATTGGTQASWTAQRQLQSHGVQSGALAFTASTPAGVTVVQTTGAVAETSFVVNDTSVGKNIKQRITAAVASTPAGISATVGTSCGSGSASVSVDTTPASGNQTLCVRVTSSSTAVSGNVILTVSGAQRPAPGWTTAATTVAVGVTVQAAGLALACGGSTTPAPSYRVTWNSVGADFYVIQRASSASGSWSYAGYTTGLQYVEDTWSQGQQSYFRVLAYKDWAVVETSNVLSVRRSGNSNNFTCGAA